MRVGGACRVPPEARVVYGEGGVVDRGIGLEDAVDSGGERATDYTADGQLKVSAGAEYPARRRYAYRVESRNEC